MQRDFFNPLALEVAPRLLGALLTVDSPDFGPVTLRISEVEAYHGVGTPPPYDGGSHARDRKTERNAAMFGPPGHAYIYLNYGMHFAINLVCGLEGSASGVLLRSGEIVAGVDAALARRLQKRVQYGHSTSSKTNGSTIAPHLLARGPGNLATALGVTLQEHDSLDLFADPFSIALPDTPIDATQIKSGPRVGVAGVWGGPEFPWRFWLAGDKTVSAFRPGRGANPSNGAVL